MSSAGRILGCCFGGHYRGRSFAADPDPVGWLRASCGSRLGEVTRTQEDPIGLAGGLNLYGYANGDPVNLRDPFGLSADTVDAPMQAKLGEICAVVDCNSVDVVAAPRSDAEAVVLMGVTATNAAVTLGTNIYFPRPLDPNSKADVAWLAHELTHVFQYKVGTAVLGGPRGALTYLLMGATDQVGFRTGLTKGGFIEPLADKVQTCFRGGSCAGSPFKPPASP